ncbi:hypothetical protein GOBAR_AA21994 [Gossypium barbadense]|uniref:Uncharacterized protein n=1 Tax=Gossypium barbadense TaxID=3634 RepID=A0A2P5X5Q1_GOSBA|nr:hypothetical protein GOBAR_AA21994 [Gossypium barbadense]
MAENGVAAVGCRWRCSRGLPTAMQRATEGDAERCQNLLKKELTVWQITEKRMAENGVAAVGCRWRCSRGLPTAMQRATEGDAERCQNLLVISGKN